MKPVGGRIVGGLAAGLAFVGLSGCDGRIDPGSGSGGYVTAPAEIGDIRDIVPAVGPVRAASEIEIGAEVTGRILELHADFNDPVNAGDLLARIDPAPFESAAAQARAQLAARDASARSASARLDEARARAARLERLVAQSTGSRADLESIRFEIRALEAELEAANAKAELARETLRRAEIDVERTAIRSPVDGFVLDRRVEQGQAVNALQTSPTVFVVASDLDRMLIEARVPEGDITRVEEGMTVRATVDANPGHAIAGEIVAIRRAPVRQGRFVSYDVIVEVDNRLGILLPGMTASVEFVRSDARSVLRIPVEALYFEPRDYVPEFPLDMIAELERRAGRELPSDPNLRRAMLRGFETGQLHRRGLRRVFVAVDQGWHAREIRVGGEDQAHVEVTAGLEAGDEVIVGHVR